MARWLAVAAFTTLGIVGISAAFGFEALMDRTARPLLLICAVLVIVYTGAAVYLGWISAIGYVGQIYHYERNKEPALFWMLVILYLGLAGPTAWYMAVLLLGR